MSPEEALNYFARQVEDRNLDNYRLVIYVFHLSYHPFVLPRTVRDIRRNEYTARIAVGGGWLESILAENTDLLNRMRDVTLIPVEIESHMTPRIYYVFETNRGRQIFDVAMWGSGGSIFVNGVQIEWDDMFYDIIRPFLPIQTLYTMDRMYGRYEDSWPWQAGE